jgi:hypothetical protein
MLAFLYLPIVSENRVLISFGKLFRFWKPNGMQWIPGY